MEEEGEEVVVEEEKEEAEGAVDCGAVTPPRLVRPTVRSTAQCTTMQPTTAQCEAGVAMPAATAGARAAITQRDPTRGYHHRNPNPAGARRVR